MFDDNAAVISRPNTIHSLAASLVKELGLEDAIRVCKANYWDGVLRVLSAQQVPARQTMGTNFFID